MRSFEKEELRPLESKEGWSCEVVVFGGEESSNLRASTSNRGCLLLFGGEGSVVSRYSL